MTTSSTPKTPVLRWPYGSLPGFVTQVNDGSPGVQVSQPRKNVTITVNWNAQNVDSVGAGLAVIGNVLQASGSTTASILVSAHTGSTYVVLSGDQGKLVTNSNSSGVAVTLAQSGSAGFATGWYAYFQNGNSGGGGNTDAVVVTPATSTINGYAAMALAPRQGALVVGDGANYEAIVGSPFFTLAASGGSYAIAHQFLSAARGSFALDLQIGNATSASVASGQQSTAVGNNNAATGSLSSTLGSGNSAGATNATALGANNTARVGANATAVGSANTVLAAQATGVGYLNNVSAAAATAVGSSNGVGAANGAALGFDNLLNGINSSAVGVAGDDRGNNGAIIHSTVALGQHGAAIRGRSQLEEYVFVASTTGSLAVQLTTDGLTPSFGAGSANVANLGTSMTQMFDCWFEMTDTSSGNYATYYMATPGSISQAATRASTALGTGTPAFTAGPVSGTPLVPASPPTITADGTNGGYNVSGTPPVANTNVVYMVARLRILTTRFN